MTSAARPSRLGAGPIAAALMLASCHHAAGPTPVPRRGQLNVVAVEVLVLESFPPQVHAHIVGEVPNVCTVVDGIQQRREERTVTLTITTCTMGEVCILLLPPPVELTVPLDGPFESGEYLLRVNGVERNFRI